MIQILQENPFFIVIFKPAGVSVHNEKPSVADFLTEQKRPLHFVNRLDRETSGLMIVATQPDFHAGLAEALDKGRKIYRALLRGAWKAGSPEVSWKWALTDKAEGRQNPQGVSSERVPCESIATLVRSNKYFSEVSVEIKTGRQHQIRKHAAISGQPLVGDNRYNEKKYNQMIADRYKENRLWLHCENMEFAFKNESYKFENKLNLDVFFK